MHAEIAGCTRDRCGMRPSLRKADRVFPAASLTFPENALMGESMPAGRSGAREWIGHRSADPRPPDARRCVRTALYMCGAVYV